MGELDRQESPPTTRSGWGLVGPKREGLAARQHVLTAET